MTYILCNVSVDRPVLSQVKHNTPIILPGFQSVDVPDELNQQESVSVSMYHTVSLHIYFFSPLTTKCSNGILLLVVVV